MLLRLLPVLFGVAASIPFLGTEQSVAVKGQLTCNGTAAVGIRVKLFEKDPSMSYLPLLNRFIFQSLMISSMKL